MSKFSAFMKANKKVKENEKFAPTASLLGSDGTPVSEPQFTQCKAVY